MWKLYKDCKQNAGNGEQIECNENLLTHIWINQYIFKKYIKKNVDHTHVLFLLFAHLFRKNVCFQVKKL